MTAPIGQSHDFHRRFYYGYNMSSHDILKLLHQIGYSVEVIPVHASYKTSSYDDMYSVCKLFATQSWLHPVNVTREEILRDIGDIGEYTRIKHAEMARYVQDECFDGQLYSMDMSLDILVVSRNYALIVSPL